jgi:hypothetical protein
MTFVLWHMLRGNSILLGYKAASYPWRTGSSILPPWILKTCTFKVYISVISEARVGAVVWSTALKAKGLGVCSRWRYWNFSLSKSFRPHYGLGVDSASNRNEHQEYFLGAKGGRCVGLIAMCRMSWNLGALTPFMFQVNVLAIVFTTITWRA